MTDSTSNRAQVILNWIKKRHVKKIIQWILVFLSFIYIGHFFVTQRDSLQIAFSLDFSIVCSIIFFKVINILLSAYRYLLVIEKCGKQKIRFMEWLKINILGRFLNLIAPQLGNLYRSHHLKEVYKVPYTHYISSYFSFLWMDTTLNMLVAAVLVAVMSPTLMIGQFNACLLLTTIALLIFSIPFICLGICKLSSALLKKSLWIQSKIHEVFSVTIENLKDPKYMLQVLLLGLLQLPVVCILYLLYFRCFNIDAGIPTILLFYSLYRVSLYLNITPGNLGVREVAFGILSDLMQIGKPEGILISTISRVFNYVIIIGAAIPMGGFSLIKNAKQLASKQDQ